MKTKTRKEGKKMTKKQESKLKSNKFNKNLYNWFFLNQKTIVITKSVIS